jgi:hypothetical protein
LARARELARDLRQQIDTGRDPRAEQEEARERQAQARTFGALASRYIEEYAKPRKKSWRGDERILRTQLLPVLRDRPVSAITKADCKDLIGAVVKRGAAVYADRTLACLRKILNFGIDELEWIEINPCQRIKAQTYPKKRRRQRVLTDEETVRLWQHLAAPPAEANAEQMRL